MSWKMQAAESMQTEGGGNEYCSLERMRAAQHDLSLFRLPNRATSENKNLVKKPDY